MNLRGIFPPIITPFHHDDVDHGALGANIEKWLRTGLAGIVVLGTNGEAALLNDDESERVIAKAREHVARDRLLIAGTARESTRSTMAATRRAAERGADAVLVRTPASYKSRMTTEAFVSHYTAVADASPVPVVLYNFATATGVNLPVDAVARLSEHPNIIGMKESGVDMAYLAELVDRSAARFQVVVGSAPTFYAAMTLGAVGGVLALACVVPDLCVQLHQLVTDGHHAEARALQRRLTPLARLVTTAYGVPGLKAALDLVGYRGGNPRPPLWPVPPHAITEIRQQLELLEIPVA